MTEAGKKNNSVMEVFRQLLTITDHGAELLSVPEPVQAKLGEARAAVRREREQIIHSTKLDYFRTSENRYAHYLAAALACLAKRTSILDMGSAPGHVDIGLYLLGFLSIKGINLNAEWRALYPSPDWLDTFAVIEHNMEEQPLPFPNDTFDAVLFTEVLEHIAIRDPVWIMQEMRRVLQPGGIIIFSTPNVCNISNIHALMHGRNVFWDPEIFYGSLDRHNHEYTVAEVEKCFRKAGFTQRWMWGINDHSNWRGGASSEFAYAFTEKYGDEHILTRNTIVAVYERIDG